MRFLGVWLHGFSSSRDEKLLHIVATHRFRGRSSMI